MAAQTLYLGADGGTAVILFSLYRPAASCIYFRFFRGQRGGTGGYFSEKDTDIV